MKTALVVVDVQKFFLRDAPNDLPAKIAAEIKRSNYDAVAFAVFKNNSDSNFVKSLKWSKCQSDEDAKLPDAFKPHASDINVFERATFSAFESTELDTYLKNNRIEKVVLCGVDTDACVLATAFSAFDRGYLVDVNFDLTYSGADLESEAQIIIKRNIIAKRS